MIILKHLISTHQWNYLSDTSNIILRFVHEADRALDLKYDMYAQCHADDMPDTITKAHHRWIKGW